MIMKARPATEKPDHIRSELADKFREAVAHLGGNPQAIDNEINLLLAAYNQPHRLYHDLRHIKTLMTPLKEAAGQEAAEGSPRTILQALELAGGKDANGREQRFDAEKTIGAVGHDCVYIGADGGAGICGPLVAAYVEEKDGNLYLHTPEALPDGSPEQKILRMVRQIFGVKEGASIPLKKDPQLGNRDENELLSALALATTLQKAGVADAHIASVICQVEATVPFRGGNPAAELKARLEQVNEDFSLGLDPQEQQQCITLATHFANEDVKNFRGPLGPFIYNTFLLAPEGAPDLRGKPSTATSYLKVLRGTVDGTIPYFRNISDRIFRHDGREDGLQYPPPAELKKYQAAVEANLDKMTVHMQAKLVSMAYLHALTKKLGCPDVGLGDLMPYLNFPQIKRQEGNPENQEIYHILKNGTGNADIYTFDDKGKRVRFDITASPLTAYLWEHLGREGMLETYCDVRNYIEKAGGGEEMDDSMPVLKILQRKMGPDLFADIYKTIYPQATAAVREVMDFNRPFIIDHRDRRIGIGRS